MKHEFTRAVIKVSASGRLYLKEQLYSNANKLQSSLIDSCYLIVYYPPDFADLQDSLLNWQEAFATMSSYDIDLSFDAK